MRFAIYLRLATGLALLGSATAWGESVGYVKNAGGDASIVSAGKTIVAHAGTPVAQGDTIKTGASGSLGVTLKDNTVLSFGPSTSFTLEDYLFAPAKSDLKLGGRITSGSMHYVSGVIARLKPDAVAFKTPNGIIGVRGTRFAVVIQ